MSRQFERLDADDVVVFVEGVVLVDHGTAQASEIMNGLKQAVLNHKGSSSAKEKMLSDDGVSCKLLKPGKHWQKGKLRLRLEFCPDEPVAKKVVDVPNSLDEFRQ